MSLPAPRSEKSRPPIKTPQELVHIRHKITLRQYKYWVLMLKWYREAYERGTLVGDGDFDRLPIKEIERYLGYELARGELRADFEALRKEAIIYNVLGKDGKPAQRGVGFISEWEISSNWAGFKLPDFLKESMRNLDQRDAIFHQLNWDVFNSLAGKYEAILYKLCRDYVRVGQTPMMTIGTFRDYMGLNEHEYAEFKDLNKFVISGPVRKINESQITDIEIAVLPFERTARRVVGVQFAVKAKQQVGLPFGDNPAFAAARTTIPLIQQQKYLSEKSAEEIAFAIERANAYADDQEAKGKPINLGAIYQTAILQGWGAEYKSKLALEHQKREKKAKPRTQPRPANTESASDPQEQVRRQTALDAFDALAEEGREQLLGEFMKAHPALATNTRKSPGGALVRRTLGQWLVSRGE